MFTYRDKTALITGASSGIGEAFARALAQRGAHVILVARSADKLEQLAAELRQQHQMRATVIAQDLAQAGAATAVYQAVQAQGLPIDILINNAGFGTYGTFDQVPWERQRDEVNLNVMALVEMTHLVLPTMVAQHTGAIINVASTAAFQPDSYMAIYGATKAFVLSFTAAIYAENRRRGVRILALCPGATDSAFFDVVGTDSFAFGQHLSPEAVATIGLRALEHGKGMVVTGWMNSAVTVFERILPPATMARMTERLLRPRTPAKKA